MPSSNSNARKSQRSGSRGKSNSRSNTPRKAQPPSSPPFSYAQIASGGEDKAVPPSSPPMLPSSPPGPQSRPPQQRQQQQRSATPNDGRWDHDQLDPATARAFEEALDDVHTRFILNLPPEELQTTDRLFFQLEQAFWFYDDFHCDESSRDDTKPDLPRFKHARPFAKKMFQISPLLTGSQHQFDAMWEEFAAYKRTISTYGIILLNADCTKVALCQVWNGKSWTFPAGKVNQHERGIEAAARETYEETGFDVNCKLGKARLMKDAVDASGQSLPWKPLRDDDRLFYVEEPSGKRRTCFVCKGVPESFPFEPVARKEVSTIAWHPINDLPKKSYAVLPFMGHLNRWIKRNHPRSQSRSGSNNSASRKKNRSNSNPSSGGRSEEVSPGKKRSSSAKKDRKSNKQRTNSRGKVREDDPIALSALAKPGDENGWSESDMFATNEALLGRKITYDGNPHQFADKGFGGIDPHAFRVVGGTFMNAGDRGGSLAPPPEASKLQPLFRPYGGGDGSGGGGGVTPGASEDEGDGGDGGELKPFFSDGGVTPWGDVVTEAIAEDVATAAAGHVFRDDDADAAKEKSESAAANSTEGGKNNKRKKKKKKKEAASPTESSPKVVPFGGGSNASGLALLHMLRGGGGSDKLSGGEDESSSAGEDEESPSDEDLKTSVPPSPPPRTHQGAAGSALGVFMTDAEITAQSQRGKGGQSGTVRDDADAAKEEATQRMKKSSQDDEHLQYLREWVQSLPSPEPTERFGEFNFDVEAIMNAMVLQH